MQQFTHHFRLSFVIVLFRAAILSGIRTNKIRATLILLSRPRKKPRSIEIVQFENAVYLDELAWRDIRMSHGSLPFLVDVMNGSQANGSLGCYDR